jgi:uncharacterized damage-inducible protein DinB
MTTRLRTLHLARFACLALLLVLACLPVAAQEEGGEMAAADPVGGAMAADLGRAADKLVQLAEAIPADKYGWRPADGVRSVSEALMHVANANFGLSAVLGVDKPTDLPEDLEAVTDKAQVVALLKTSLDHARQAVETATGGDMASEHQMFGRTMVTADVLMIILSHNHEHLGQAIAYARSLGVAPPWSQG